MRSVLTQQDIIKLQEVLATKEDIRELKSELEIEKLRCEVHKNSEDTAENKGSTQENKELIQELHIKIDKFIDSLDTQRTKYSALAFQVHRHDDWLKQIARSRNRTDLITPIQISQNLLRYEHEFIGH